VRYVKTEHSAEMIVTKTDLRILDQAMDKFRFAASCFGMAEEMMAVEALHDAIAGAGNDDEQVRDEDQEEEDEVEGNGDDLVEPDVHDVPLDGIPV